LLTLVVEDDIALANVIVAALREEAWEPTHAATGSEGLRLALAGTFDLIILDVMLPAVDGFAIVSRLRSAGMTTPVLFLTALGSVDDRVRGLDAGGDDYLTKPFDVQELLARVRALARRELIATAVAADLVYGQLTLRPDAHEVIADGNLLNLTAKEFALFEYMLRNAEQILTREQIFNRIWGYDSEVGASVVDVYMHYVRKKLAPFACDGYIRTVRGIGYMMKE